MLLNTGRFQLQQSRIARSQARTACRQLVVVASSTDGTTAAPAAAVRKSPVRRNSTAGTQHSHSDAPADMRQTHNSTPAARQPSGVAFGSKSQQIKVQGEDVRHRMAAHTQGALRALGADGADAEAPPAADMALSGRADVAVDKYRPGDLVSGVVTGIAPYGAFVDTEDGAAGLIHISKMSHEQISAVGDVFKVGETIKALVLRVDHETGRLSLSTKKLEQQPGDLLNLSREEFFQRAEEQHEAPQAADKAAPAFHKYRARNLVSGVVARVAQYGAFVDTEDGVTGLIHISQISHERLSGAGDVFQVGEQIKALVLNMDPQAGRLSLSTKKLEQQPGDLLNLSREEFCQQAEEQHGQAAKDAARAKFAASSPKRGDIVDGEVTGVRSHAAFVDLAQGCCGLLHISQVSQERFETVEQVFKVGDKLRAVVLSQGLDMQRLILTIKGLEKEPGELLQLNSEQRDEFFRQAEARAAAGYSNIIGGASA